jgi:hypothetical protein
LLLPLFASLFYEGVKCDVRNFFDRYKPEHHLAMAKGMVRKSLLRTLHNQALAQPLYPLQARGFLIIAQS